MSLSESYNYEEVDVYHKKTPNPAWWIYTAVIPIPSDTTGVVL